MKFFYSFIIISFLSGISYAQTSLSGELVYLEASATSINIVDASITVGNNPGFSEGDQLLIIQVKGADIDLTNTTSFGHVNDYNGAGAFEVAQICSIDGTTLTLDYFLENDYDPNGLVQVIKIPHYDNLDIDGTVFSKPWNGSTGGIFVLSAETVNLNADIDMSGLGFRGGQFINSTLDCAWFQPKTAFYYNNSNEAAEKGEGIAILSPVYRYGKGAPANGGGGGNDHNSGGGGGGNGVLGGVAGINGETSTFLCKGQHPGVGGHALNYVDGLFLGGGGGAGQGNNNRGTSGANGGGIVILMAETLNANGYKIMSNGVNADNTNGGDGAGGGGAGGSVYLDVATVNGQLAIETNGGNGGNVHDLSGGRCFGPGGGGAGGVLKFTGNLPALVTYSMVPGISGINSHSSSACFNSPSQATPGSNGVILENQPIPTGTIDYSLCDVPLPIELAYFKAAPQDRTVVLKWTTLTEENNDFFTIERSRDGQSFSEVARVDGAGNSTETIDYRYVHETPWSGRSYYRLKQTDINGSEAFSKTELVFIDKDFDIFNIYPNPIKGSKEINVEILAANDLEGEIKIFNLLGAEQSNSIFTINEGFNTIKLDIAKLAAGTYILRIGSGINSITRRIVIL